MRTDHNFIRLMAKVIDIIYCKARAMCFPTKTNSLIGYKEKAGILGIKMVLTLIGSPNSQADWRNGQNHIFSLSQDEVAGLIKKEGVNIRDRVEYVRI